MVRAPGRGSLLLRSITDDTRLREYLKALTWIFQTKRSNPKTLARLIEIGRPAGLCLGNGFWESSYDSGSYREVDSALVTYGRRGSCDACPSLRSFMFGGFDLEATSSDYFTHLLSSAWPDLQRLALYQVRWSPLSTERTASDRFWKLYPPPNFSLQHLLINFLASPRPSWRTLWGLDEDRSSMQIQSESAHVAQSESPDYGTGAFTGSSSHFRGSWLHWLLLNSTHSLTSLCLANLSEDLPLDAFKTIREACPGLMDLSITGYEGNELLGDILTEGAGRLLSLTLGGIVSIAVVRRNPVTEGLEQCNTPVLASAGILSNSRAKLRYLELQSLELFERLSILEHLRMGKLPSLSHIVLAKASLVHPEVQRLGKYCTSAGIALRVKR